MSLELSDQEREGWLTWRRHGIGASDLPAIMGVSPYGSPWTVWASKVGLLPPSPTSERQQIGLELEDAVARMFRRRTGLAVVGEQTRCEHFHYGWARCTVDGFVVEAPVSPDGPEALGTWQAKTDGRFGWDEIPEAHVIQCTWEMLVTEYRHAWLAVLHNGFRFEVYELDYDEQLAVRMFEAADQLWRHVVDGTPPDIDGSEATAKALAQAWPQERIGATAEVPRILVADWRRLREQRLQAERRAKAFKALEDEAANALKAAAEDAEVLTVDGQPHLTLRQTVRKGHWVEGGTYRTLRDLVTP